MQAGSRFCCLCHGRHRQPLTSLNKCLYSCSPEGQHYPALYHKRGGQHDEEDADKPTDGCVFLRAVIKGWQRKATHLMWSVRIVVVVPES